MPELTPPPARLRAASASPKLRCASRADSRMPASGRSVGIDKTRRAWSKPRSGPLATRHWRRSAGADGTPFARLKVAQLALKVEAQRLSLDETKRRLLDVTEANAALDEIGSTMRDALLNWPARVSGLIAAEISVDPHLLQTILQSHINDLLTEAADRFDPAGLGGDRSPQP